MDDEQVTPQDEARRNSPKTANEAPVDKMTADALAAVAAVAGAGDGYCYWNDKKYSDGATVCDNRQRYKCWNGKWVDIGNC